MKKLLLFIWLFVPVFAFAQISATPQFKRNSHPDSLLGYSLPGITGTHWLPDTAWLNKYGTAIFSHQFKVTGTPDTVRLSLDTIKGISENTYNVVFNPTTGFLRQDTVKYARKKYVDSLLLVGSGISHASNGLHLSGDTAQFGGIINQNTYGEITGNHEVLIGDTTNGNYYGVYTNNDGSGNFGAAITGGASDGSVNGSVSTLKTGQIILNENSASHREIRINPGTGSGMWITDDQLFGLSNTGDYTANIETCATCLVQYNMLNVARDSLAASIAAVGSIYTTDGTLTGNRTVTGAGNTLLFTTDDGYLKNTVEMGAEFSRLFAQLDGTPAVQSFVTVSEGEAQMQAADGTDSYSRVTATSESGTNIASLLEQTSSSSVKSITLQNNVGIGIVFTDSQNNKGAVYANNYGANFTARSLVDKNYVDSVATVTSGSATPTSRQITINGIAQDLSANRTWSVGTLTSVSAGTGMSFPTITGTGAVKADTTVLQTVANFFPKGDTRYLKSSVISGLANPTATIGFTAVNGSAITGMRSDGAPKADSTIIRSVANSYSLSGMQTKLNNYLLKTDTTSAFANLVHINGAETILGPKTFSKPLTINLNSGYVEPNFSNTGFQVVGSDGNPLNNEFDSFGDHVIIRGNRFNGTRTSRTKILAGNEILALAAGGAVSTTGQTYEAAGSHIFVAHNDWSTTDHSLDQIFKVVKSGDTVLTSAFEINQDYSAGVAYNFSIGQLSTANYWGGPSTNRGLTIVAPAGNSGANQPYLELVTPSDNTANSQGSLFWVSQSQTLQSNYRIAAINALQSGGTTGNANGQLQLYSKGSGGLAIFMIGKNDQTIEFPHYTTNNGILYTDSSGNVSQSTALPSGTTGTTQTAGDNSTKVATTAYVTTPGAIAPTTVNGNTFTTGTYTLTGASGKTFTFNNTMTFAGTDAQTYTFPTTTATIARTDAAQTFTGNQTFSAMVYGTGGYSSNGNTTSSNLYVSSNNTLGISSGSTPLLFGGASTVYGRTLFNGQTSTQIGIGSSAADEIWGNEPITTPSSGTNAAVGGHVFKAPTITVTAGSTVTDAFNTMFQGAPSGATGNWNVWMKYGISRASQFQVDTLTASMGIGTDANKRLTSINVPVTQASADLTAQSSAGNITTFTVGASTATFNISQYINVTAVSVDVIQGQITYTDENNTSQTVSLSNLSAIGNSTYAPVTIRAKNGTVITVKTNLTTGAGSITFDAGARITQL